MTSGEQRPLQAGMTFHLTGAAGVRFPGSGMFRSSDTILVTEEGCESLTTGVERKLSVK